ncbi:putative disulfide isomerase [Phaeomoniella chlamydospora]|uniref:Putative disulfide isomerase n=1 Tax=Phaeomoniella chlamydospora TaxID=158046 RepID=A0A0G2E874_PHACM|nr:putative disulfide isomerase [Phaeomoniella chlamydospora]
MKSTLLLWTFASVLAVPGFAAPQEEGSALSVEEAIGKPAVDKSTSALSAADDTSDDSSTVFNGIKVPPMLDIEGDKWDETVKEGWWFVKHYSPYCGHCAAIAPTWQTLYEFYYTSSPIQSQTKAEQSTESSLNSFDNFYDFHFGSLNCIAYGEICEKHDVKAWPTFLLYKDGVLVEKFTGKKNLQEISHFVEEKLEGIRPGSRPKDGPKLPEAGATSVETDVPPDNPLAKDKDAAGGVAAAEKHMEKIAEQATGAEEKLEAPKSAPPKKEKTGPTPNQQGTSVSLTAESFQKLVTTTEEPWFIKFYAPWCAHCQALAPTWDQLAKELKGELNVGEVNCDAEPRLCKDAKIKGFPTMYFLRGGERVEYEGLRGLGDLLKYSRSAMDSDVKDVDAAQFKEMEETEEVIFLYFYDHATTSEDFAALDRLTLSLIGHAKIVKTNSAVLADRFKISTWPRLLVSRDGRPTYYTGLAPSEMRDFRQVLTWMQSVWLPIVPELTASNAREIMDGHYVVLGALTHSRPDEFKQGKRELKNAALEWMDKQTQLFQLERQELRDAKQLRIEEADDRNDQRALRQAKSRRITIREDDRKQVRFAWVDADFWERWLKTTFGIDVQKGERVIINDQDNRRYWDTTESGAFITPSRTSILETIPKVISSPPKLRAKSTIGAIENFFFQIKNFISRHKIIAIITLVISVIVGLLYFRRKLLQYDPERKHRGHASNGILGEKTTSTGGSFLGNLFGGKNGYFHLDGKEGLLSSGGAKAD